MNRSTTTWIIIAVGVLVILFNTFYIVEQRQQALVVRFGDRVRVVNAGRTADAGL